MICQTCGDPIDRQNNGRQEWRAIPAIAEWIVGLSDGIVVIRGESECKLQKLLSWRKSAILAAGEGRFQSVLT